MFAQLAGPAQSGTKHRCWELTGYEFLTSDSEGAEAIDFTHPSKSATVPFSAVAAWLDRLTPLYPLARLTPYLRVLNAS